MPLRSAIPFVLFALAGAPGALGQVGLTDPLFSAVPFDRWLAESDQTGFRWAARVGGAKLNGHQRLQTRVEIQIDGNELVNRRGHGQLVIMIQFQDSAERTYQTHGVLDLQEVKDDVGKSNIQYLQDAFILPGDYLVSMAIFDAKTREHSTLQKPLHVNPLRGDPLGNAWKDLPSVELMHAMDTPDSWFLPNLKGRLHLPLTTQRPIRIEVLMNGSSPGPSRGLSLGTASNRNLANLLPALKVLSQIEVMGEALHLTLLDILNRRVMFQQDTMRRLDWARLRGALTEADPNKIDVRALEHREQNAQYFVEQVRQRLATTEEPFRVLIVLSGPMTFLSGEDMHPIELPAKPNAMVYYVRHRLPPERLALNPIFESPSRMGRRNSTRPGQLPASLEPFDSLAPLLKPLKPRLFDVYTPEQFRKALATMLEEIARL